MCCVICIHISQSSDASIILFDQFLYVWGLCIALTYTQTRCMSRIGIRTRYAQFISIRLKFWLWPDCGLWWWFVNDMNIFVYNFFFSLFFGFMKSTWNAERKNLSTHRGTSSNTNKKIRNEERAMAETAKKRTLRTSYVRTAKRKPNVFS